ncbi:hypothetical protein CLTEP_12030 [Clostridium tepidiprofundi DSM 19306]|uniref:DUF4349 domain-containing protein n=1 Tax=Clostridium tepidiprofundi DSM 19306 TaxID=1121338 RepID=A0A151B4N7_9CLOT|nr:DUF4349 domain-containing protein [Clostridium tepidiprofundi]KYH34881.1 hypothetical protein CLTEP_12030 [Clostridium tepidiprofundi DSM 19306]
MKNLYRKYVIVLLLAFAVSFIFIGCGAEKKNLKDSATITESARDENKSDSKGSMALNDNNYGQHIKDNSKIIVYKTIELETLKFDEVKNKILQRTKAYGGYVQSSNIEGIGIRQKHDNANRYANLVLRIPKNNLRNFENDINNLDCSIVDISTRTEDVTMQYFDTEAHLKSLKIEEERLLNLLKKTGELKDIIQVERELQNVRYEIEKLTGSLRKLDNLVEYTTFTVHIREVHEIKENPVTMGERIISAFKTSVKYLVKFFKEILIIIFAIIPFAIVFGIIGFIVYKTIIKLKKNSGHNEIDDNK